MASTKKSKVYRARNLPGYADRLAVIELLAQCLPDIALDDVQLGSLAFAVDPWSHSPTKTATLMFKRAPVVISLDPNSTEWTFPMPGHKSPLILDNHFYGLTPLNEVDHTAHTNDCIVISGLASHPMGSWQPRGEKFFMWIRDALPQRLPGVRFMIYGYDTSFTRSKSFQVIPDLAVSLISELKAGGWTALVAKPLLFLAHSLGGVVLKQALVMLAGSGEREKQIVSIIKGAIFFGVPSVGMAVPDIYEMLGEQPNKVLIDDLSDQSDYVPELEKQFDGISYTRGMVLFWAYETQQTPSLSISRGRWSRSGPDRIMVSPESATGGRYRFYEDSILQVDYDHSNMVKFKEGDRLIPILADKLREIIQHGALDRGGSVAVEGSHKQSVELPKSISPDRQRTRDMSTKALRKLTENTRWFNGGMFYPTPDYIPSLTNSFGVLKQSLVAPERDHRLEQIDENASHTFGWVFDDPSIGLASWLLKGEGIFWISGKPGSGKSTMMKFIWNDSRTAELLHRWGSSSHNILIDFFFHHRGSAIQKSFEGLLRSVLNQLLEARPELCVFLEGTVESAFPQRVAVWRESDDDEADLVIPGELWTKKVLQESLKAILFQNTMDIDIFFLFDALDEYDGRPEFIADFLKQLVKSLSSRTRVRILFSSRPWKIFLDEFESCLGFKIHEHTENDIREYSASFMLPNAPGAQALLELREEIVRRAQGVFLWVKLVMQELSLVAAESFQNGVDNQMLGLKLRQKLDGLPDQLDQFYHAIIERLPDVFRWDAYVLLECLVRSRVNLGPEEAIQLLGLSRRINYAEVKKIVKEESMKFITSIKDQIDQIDKIKSLSGGLVEVWNDGGGFYLQFMHQTVHDFVEQPQFKHAMLGLRGKTTHENGHCFLTKTLWLRREVVGLLVTQFEEVRTLTFHHKDPDHAGILWGKRLAFHAKEAERTAGSSQYRLLTSITTSTALSRNMKDWWAWTPLTFAVSIGLRLFLRDILHNDKKAIMNCPGGLLSAIITSLDYGWCGPMEAIEMVMFIVENGYQVNKDESTILEVFDRIWKGMFSKDASIDAIHFTSERAFCSTEEYVALICEALEGYSDTRNVTWFKMGDSVTEASSKSMLLRSSPPEVIERLLALGADPNVLDSRGKTALDSVVLNVTGCYSEKQDIFWSDTGMYRVCKALVINGGKLRTTSVHQWRSMVERFNKSCYNIDFLNDRPFSKWFEDTAEGVKSEGTEGSTRSLNALAKMTLGVFKKDNNSPLSKI